MHGHQDRDKRSDGINGINGINGIKTGLERDLKLRQPRALHESLDLWFENGLKLLLKCLGKSLAIP